MTVRTPATIEAEDSRAKRYDGAVADVPLYYVATTVSVPDGGTVLLGGVKRLREGRNEFGVPLLSKIPYIDRLFRNVGIGREDGKLDDDGHATHHHPRGRRRTLGHRSRVTSRNKTSQHLRFHLIVVPEVFLWMSVTLVNSRSAIFWGALLGRHRGGIGGLWRPWSGETSSRTWL